jgi:hypothetical protein
MRLKIVWKKGANTSVTAKIKWMDGDDSTFDQSPKKKYSWPH